MGICLIPFQHDRTGLVQMSIILLNDPHKKVRPAGAIRADVAWKLFLPDKMGDISQEDRKSLVKFTHWFWWELSDRLGFMRKDAADPVYVITPAMTDSSRELMVRMSSMWTDEVYLIDSPEQDMDLSVVGKNLWKAPVVNLMSDDTPLLKNMTVDHHDAVTKFLMPALGSARAFMRTYTITKNSSYSRLHSHSAVEEHYIVLRGKGTLRYGGHKVALSDNDIVSKPVGPDNYSQFLADRGEEMTILDIEIWPDSTQNAKDTVLYPDHKEVFMRGQAWSAIIQSEQLMSAGDFQRNYEKGYEREADGSWKSKKIPGAGERTAD